MQTMKMLALAVVAVLLIKMVSAVALARETNSQISLSLNVTNIGAIPKPAEKDNPFQEYEMRLKLEKTPNPRGWEKLWNNFDFSTTIGVKGDEAMDDASYIVWRSRNGKFLFGPKVKSAYPIASSSTRRNYYWFGFYLTREF